ncbi:hypothetical protein E2C01_036101 [Portunus trituberculatus]|uniref:Uncharacterized protein n=1 Tax=Portunus trituberculatus TaxID=210409 RepID=A0A5B7FB45_PORTR|nr:hypothetical protein [Portunus trituberculatus]
MQNIAVDAHGGCQRRQHRNPKSSTGHPADLGAVLPGAIVVVEGTVVNQQRQDRQQRHAPGTHGRLPHKSRNVGTHHLDKVEVLMHCLHQHPPEGRQDEVVQGDSHAAAQRDADCLGPPPPLKEKEGEENEQKAEQGKATTHHCNGVQHGRVRARESRRLVVINELREAGEVVAVTHVVVSLAPSGVAAFLRPATAVAAGLKVPEDTFGVIARKPRFEVYFDWFSQAAHFCAKGGLYHLTVHLVATLPSFQSLHCFTLLKEFIVPVHGKEKSQRLVVGFLFLRLFTRRYMQADVRRQDDGGCRVLQIGLGDPDHQCFFPLSAHRLLHGLVTNHWGLWSQREALYS